MRKQYSEEELTSPNRTYLSMSYVRETATGTGSNRILEMEAMDSGQFKVTISRPGIRIGKEKPRSWYMPMEDWDSYYAQNIRKGYFVTKREKLAKKEIRVGSNAIIEEPSVRELVRILMEAAQKTMDENYTIQVDDVTDEMLEFGRKTLSDLAKDKDRISPAQFNARLDVLFAAVPRRIDRLADKHAARSADFDRILKEESELLEFIVGQVRASNNADTAAGITVLEKNGLEIRPVTAEEETEVHTLMGDSAKKANRIWKVSNARTKQAFDALTTEEGMSFENGGIKKLFHGSKMENFWSICVNGLLLNPDAVIQGKAFGNGIYFAPLARKSLGYTSYNNKGFLAIYRVATGVPYDIYADSNSESIRTSLNYTMLQRLQPGASCTWAYGNVPGHYLANDEVIIYRENQCDIEYLIEVV